MLKAQFTNKRTIGKVSIDQDYNTNSKRHKNIRNRISNIPKPLIEEIYCHLPKKDTVNFIQAIILGHEKRKNLIPKQINQVRKRCLNNILSNDKYLTQSLIKKLKNKALSQNYEEIDRLEALIPFIQKKEINEIFPYIIDVLNKNTEKLDNLKKSDPQNIDKIEHIKKSNIDILDSLISKTHDLDKNKTIQIQNIIDKLFNHSENEEYAIKSKEYVIEKLIEHTTNMEGEIFNKTIDIAEKFLNQSYKNSSDIETHKKSNTKILKILICSLDDPDEEDSLFINNKNKIIENSLKYLSITEKNEFSDISNPVFISLVANIKYLEEETIKKILYTLENIDYSKNNHQYFKLSVYFIIGATMLLDKHRVQEKSKDKINNQEFNDSIRMKLKSFFNIFFENFQSSADHISSLENIFYIFDIIDDKDSKEKLSKLLLDQLTNPEKSKIFPELSFLNIMRSLDQNIPYPIEDGDTENLSKLYNIQKYMEKYIQNKEINPEYAKEMLEELYVNIRNLTDRDSIPNIFTQELDGTIFRLLNLINFYEISHHIFDPDEEISFIVANNIDYTADNNSNNKKNGINYLIRQLAISSEGKIERSSNIEFIKENEIIEKIHENLYFIETHQLLDKINYSNLYKIYNEISIFINSSDFNNNEKQKLISFQEIISKKLNELHIIGMMKQYTNILD